ncbi:MAG TPA: hypothetical protein VFX89_08180 [Gammaproteobacteria bacterium]|nr:hypothetical protein [Gammaproteobacteria bacterium]
MATKRLRELRQNYRAAYTAYMTCVHALSDATLRGEWPTEKLLTAEAMAFAELTTVRRTLLDALHEHSRKEHVRKVHPPERASKSGDVSEANSG